MYVNKEDLNSRLVFANVCFFHGFAHKVRLDVSEERTYHQATGSQTRYKLKVFLAICSRKSLMTESMYSLLVVVGSVYDVVS